MDLIVVKQFGDYAKGARLTGAAADKVLADKQDHFCVKVEASAPTPVIPAKPAK